MSGKKGSIKLSVSDQKYLNNLKNKNIIGELGCTWLRDEYDLDYW